MAFSFSLDPLRFSRQKTVSATPILLGLNYWRWGLTRKNNSERGRPRWPWWEPGERLGGRVWSRPNMPLWTYAKKIWPSGVSPKRASKMQLSDVDLRSGGGWLIEPFRNWYVCTAFRISVSSYRLISQCICVCPTLLRNLKSTVPIDGPEFWYRPTITVPLSRN